MPTNLLLKEKQRVYHKRTDLRRDQNRGCSLQNIVFTDMKVRYLAEVEKCVEFHDVHLPGAAIRARVIA